MTQTAPYWRDAIDPAVEPGHIRIVKGVLTDAARGGRNVPYKLYFPLDAADDVPLVVWSHGLGGSRDGASFLARFLASHGYAVLNIQHAGTDSSLWEGKQGHPWDIIRATVIPRAASLERFRDVSFVLDSLDQLHADHPEARFRDDGPGMSGHSFGAMTTQVMAGQLFPDENDRLVSFRETRFKAGILYSPVPIGHLTGAAPKDIYSAIDMPLFHMTGTDDASPIENFGYAERLAVYENSFKAEKQLLVLQGGDHMVYNGSRGQLEENPRRGLHETIIKIAALCYWDSYLKDNAAARAWLTGGGFAAWLDGNGSYRLN